MSELLWKAVGRDYTSRGGVVWTVGETVTHPTSTRMVRDEPATYLSSSAEPGETLIGRDWPCRLLRVRPIGQVIDSDEWRFKRCALGYEVVAEVAAWRALGPNGRQVAALVARLGCLTAAEISAARDAARDAAWTAAVDAAWTAAVDAAWAAARDAARDAAAGLVVRDLLPDHHYRRLTDRVTAVIGPPESWPVPAWCDRPDDDEETP
ncbi:hypothetical protein [Pseudonocardia asaccharolytica]|uniref:Uncharacterized protein n=1 Tax=Pseudonocardia asaccharolytica DSM 44247 = NBRC 16224 TaxID=1123024 RepID=A0A511D3F0_9PSEU|nr:hypothetical protein [Pseudonocardia asaccharolytica]GEL19302.1 hypothetical protein PA7_31390 [Pseudonocardia asaccharolytica DSM 44247 = NBRC 16224]